MNKMFFLAGICLLTLGACRHRHVHDSASFIPKDTANVMLNSYLTSLGTGNDSSLHSVIMDADALRDYLNSDKGSSIKSLKVMFAHKLSYIHDGHFGVPCGDNKNGLTFILAGYDEHNDYIFFDGNNVLDNGRPCPVECPAYGTASGDLFE